MAEKEYEVGYCKPPQHTRFKKGRPSANPRGRPSKNLVTLLATGLDKKVVATESGQRRRITKREAIAAQLINKSAEADWRATKMLFDILKDSEQKSRQAQASEPTGRGPADPEAVTAQLITRLRRQILSEIAAERPV